MRACGRVGGMGELSPRPGPAKVTDQQQAADQGLGTSVYIIIIIKCH